MKKITAGLFMSRDGVVAAPTSRRRARSACAARSPSSAKTSVLDLVDAPTESPGESGDEDAKEHLPRSARASMPGAAGAVG